MRNQRVDIKAIDPATLRTTQECADTMALLDENIARMKQDVYLAKSEAKETGDYADPEWFCKLRFSLKRMKAKRQQVQDRRGVLRKIEQDSHRLTLERAFMDEARRKLEPTAFREIFDAARHVSGV